MTEAIGQQRVLVVDDEPNMCDTLADILEAQGLAVDTAANGAEALVQVEAQSYALVLMDIRMPVMDGIAALGEIKRRAPGLPVVMMTAYSDIAALDEVHRRGAEAVLPKPLNIGRLLQLVHQAAP